MNSNYKLQKYTQKLSKHNISDSKKLLYENKILYYGGGNKDKRIVNSNDIYYIEILSDKTYKSYKEFEFEEREIFNDIEKIARDYGFMRFVVSNKNDIDLFESNTYIDIHVYDDFSGCGYNYDITEYEDGEIDNIGTSNYRF